MCFKDGNGEEPTTEEKGVLFTGWLEDGGGVLVLVYENEEACPDDIGRLRMARTMEWRRGVVSNEGEVWGKFSSPFGRAFWI